MAESLRMHGVSPQSKMSLDTKTWKAFQPMRFVLHHIIGTSELPNYVP